MSSTGSDNNKVTRSFSLYTAAIIYFLLTAIVHTRFRVSLDLLWYGMGALIGLNLLSLIQKILKLDIAIFKTAFAQGLVTIATLFAITSSRNLVGTGVVLFLNLHFLYMQSSEFRKTGRLSSWFSGTNMSLAPVQEKGYFYVMVGLFLFETVLFILL